MADEILYESEARGPSARPTKPSTRQSSPRQSSLPTDGPRLHRRRRTSDPLYIPPEIIPANMSYEWKRESVYGQPAEGHLIELRENHWRAVPASRHPELASAGETLIRRPGTILMERYKYLTDEASMEDIDEAIKPLKAKEELMYGTPPGQMTRNHPSVRKGAYINQQYAPGDPIDDTSYSEP